MNQWVLLILPLIIMCGCQSKPSQNPGTRITPNDRYLAPKIVEVGNPIVHYIDTAKPSENSFFSQHTPPKINKADFYVTMKNINTEDGLALSSIVCGYKDTFGNLWFGTSGNGVSKYDGKSFTNYSSNHGLIHNLVQSIVEDDQGNIWFGTYGGVSKYNGVTFENFTTEQGLIDNEALDVFKDSSGNIWVCSMDGVSKYNPSGKDVSQGLFITYGDKDGLRADYVSDVMEDNQGYLWFGSYGVFRYDPSAEEKGKKPFADYSKKLGLEDMGVDCLVQDEEGIIWIGANEMLCRFDPSVIDSTAAAVRHFTIDDGLVDNRIITSHIDRKGNLWLGTPNGVSQFRKKDNAFLNFTTDQGLAENVVMSITEDQSGSLWFGTTGGGLSVYSGKSVVEYTSKQGLSGKAVYAITEDKNGHLWFAPSGGGLTKFHQAEKEEYGGNFINFTSEQGLHDEVLSSLTDDDGNVWFGTNWGLYKYDGIKFSIYTKEQGLPDNYITKLSKDKKGNIWVGTFNGGVSKFDQISFTNFSTDEGLVHKTIWDIHDDNNGILWIATRGGLSRYDGKHFLNFTIDQGLPDNKLSTVIQDSKGNIIIGSWGGGISVIGKNQVEKLSSSNDRQVNKTTFENFSSADGLANDVVYGVLEDSSGNIIVGSSLGLTIIKGGIINEGEQIVFGPVENYNERTGYPIKDVSNNCSMYYDSNGFVWIGTGDKLVRFDYSGVHKNPEPLTVSISDIKINNEAISWHSIEWAQKKANLDTVDPRAIPAYTSNELLVFGKKLTRRDQDTLFMNFGDIGFDGIHPYNAVPKNMVLPYAKNNISFEFVGIETSRPHLVHYQYMLKGYNKDWAPVTDQTTATFGNIREGKYSFLLKAKNPDGVWSEPISYSFKVRPPWYRSWLAYLFYAALVLGSIFYIDRYQRHRLLVQERQKGMKRELEQAKEIEKAYTELKSTQAQLIQSEKMASLGELTAGIAHEIQNPLNFVNNFSEVSSELVLEITEEIVKGDLKEASEILLDLKQNLEKIAHHGGRASSIVRGMLDHSRTSSGEKSLTDINALCDEYLRLAYHGMRAKDKSFNANFETDFDDKLPKVNVVPQEIGRVILNIINNAFQACTERSRSAVSDKQINKSTNKQKAGLVKVSTKLKNDRVEIAISDNGIGIPDDIKDKIFQPFYTTKPTGQGTGLGLSLSYDIVQAHGGNIIVTSSKGEGSEFVVQLAV